MNKLLVVVDYQEDFVKGSLGFKRAEELEDGIFNKVKNYLESGDNVIFTYDTHYNDYLNTREGKSLPIKHCIEGTKGHELFGKLGGFKYIKYNKQIRHMQKSCFGIDPFDMTRLYHFYRDVEEIEVVGIVTNMCVISNVVMFQSLFPEAAMKVDANLCASFDENLHEKALDVMESMQVKIIRGEK